MHTPQNLRFLRNGLDLTITELSEIVGIDPISLYLYEKDDYTFPVKEVDQQHDLVAISNFFMVFLDDIALSDLQREPAFDKNNFELLKACLKNNQPPLLERRKFNNKLLAYEREPPECENELAASKQLIRLMHTKYRIGEKCRYLSEKRRSGPFI